MDTAVAIVEWRLKKKRPGLGLVSHPPRATSQTGATSHFLLKKDEMPQRTLAAGDCE